MNDWLPRGVGVDSPDMEADSLQSKTTRPPLLWVEPADGEGGAVKSKKLDLETVTYALAREYPKSLSIKQSATRLASPH